MAQSERKGNDIPAPEAAPLHTRSVPTPYILQAYRHGEITETAYCENRADVTQNKAPFALKRH